MAMDLIQTVEISAAGASSIIFSNIPQDGEDLLIILSGRHTLNGTVNINLTVNSNSSSIYSSASLQGDGSSASLSALGNRTSLYSGILPGINLASNTFSDQQIYISNYSKSINKGVSIHSAQENNNTSARQELLYAMIATTSPITSIGFSLDSGALFAQYSVASIYKIA